MFKAEFWAERAPNGLFRNAKSVGMRKKRGKGRKKATNTWQNATLRKPRSFLDLLQGAQFLNFYESLQITLMSAASVICSLTQYGGAALSH